MNDTRKAIVKSLHFDETFSRNTIDSNPVKSGSLSNMPASTTGLITPTKVPPRLQINTVDMYPKIVEAAHFKGFKRQVKKVKVFDKVDRIIKDAEVTINVPIYEKTQFVQTLPTKTSVQLDLNKGGIYPVNEDSKKFHGIELPDGYLGITSPATSSSR